MSESRYSGAFFTRGIMYLKTLELMGFKSFPEKIRLEFHPGVTAVVGPNGSGKSNISDAVRWVLGEQSAKSLRGGKMEDVIFAGTENRRPLGFAEVSLSLDNSDNAMPMEFNEITITRRLYRSGEGEYRINGASCRLKDIHELFMDTGVGREGYSIIGQGKIDEILNARSEDRRLLFEEAAGIVKYKSRRQEALLKLEREKQNLLRAEDVIGEIDRQMEPLAIQSEQAKQYLDLRENLKAVQVNYFLYQTQTAEKQMEELDESLRVLRQQMETEKIKSERLQEAWEKEKSADDANDAHLKTVSQDRMALQRRVEQTDGGVRVAEEAVRHLALNEERLRKESAKKAELIQQKKTERGQEDAKLRQIEAALEEAMQIHAERQEEMQSTGAALDKTEKNLGQDQSELIRRMELLSDIRSEIRGLEEQSRQIGGARAALEREWEESRCQAQTDAAALESARQMLEAATARSHAADTDLADKQKAWEDFNERVNELNKQASAAASALSESDARRTLLRELERGFEGYQKSVRAILKQKQKNPEKFSGVCGAVGELARIAKKYETALETALGPAMHDIVTQTDQDAIEAIEFLKARQEGRATFLPLNVIKSRSLGAARQSYLQESGVLGAAKDLIEYDPLYENIFGNLLGNVFILDNSANALLFSQKYQHRFKLATLDGELFNPGGAITGGSLGGRNAGIFSRSRELKELDAVADQVRDAARASREELESAFAKRAEIFDELENLRDQTRQNFLERNEWENKMRQIQEQSARHKKNQDDLQNRQTQLAERAEQAQGISEARQGDLTAQQQDLDAIHRRLEAGQQAIAQQRARRENLLNQITAVQIEMESLKQSLNAARENWCRIEADIRQAESSALEEELEGGRREREDQERAIAEMKERLAQDQEALAAYSTEIEKAEQKKEDIRAKTQTLEQSQKTQMETLSRLANDLTRLEMKKEQIEMETRRLFDEMWDEYKITPQSAKEVKSLSLSPNQLQKEERRFKNEIQALGSVNVGAIEEYQNLKSRLDFLHAQRDDILAAERKLLDISAELATLMEKRFKERFALISQNFEQTFQEIFQGGKANLTLNSGENILEAGIDISAQPPGKKLQSLSLLSGGERALTAIALLFGILRMKPSPFCILDEIEAALDEANVNRYAGFIQKIAANTQLILITHRKGTMEAANVLYGVTMQEQGISKLVSVKLTEEKQIG
jgi:chromosome segregation protein